MDPALIKPGRLDWLVEVPYPDAEGKKQIFNIHMSKAEQFAERMLFDGVDLEVIIQIIKISLLGKLIALR